MQDTSFFARPDGFPAASPVPAQPRQHETDNPGPLATTSSSNRGWTWLPDTGTKPCRPSLMSFADNEQGGSARLAGRRPSRGGLLGRVPGVP
jgi:hypothetical protein